MKEIKMNPALAMVELVFAIVIMGIVMMSAPMLVSQANKGSLSGIQQEAIAAAATDISMILTRHWDENDTNTSLESPILITNGNILLNEALDANAIGLGRRAGTDPLSTRSFLTSEGTRLNASTLALFGARDLNETVTQFDDIDDYHGNVHNLTVATASTRAQGDYLDASLQFNTSVNYVNDTPSVGTYNSQTLALNNPLGTASLNPTSNIKMISITVTSNQGVQELDTNITLRAFSCNIGTYQIEERTLN